MDYKIKVQSGLGFSGNAAAVGTSWRGLNGGSRRGQQLCAGSDRSLELSEVGSEAGVVATVAAALRSLPRLVGSGLEALQQYLARVPPVTRAFVLLAALLSVVDQAAQAGGYPQFSSQYYPLVLSLSDPADAFRLVTSSAFFGKFGVRLLYSLYYLVTTSSALENGLLSAGASYAQLLGLQALVTAAVSAAAGYNFVSGPLLSSLVTLYSKMRPEEEM